MKILRNLKFSRSDLKNSHYAMILSGLTHRKWFFGIVRFRREPDRIPRKVHSDYRLDYGPDYEGLEWISGEPVRPRGVRSYLADQGYHV